MTALIYFVCILGGFILGVIVTCFCHAARSASQDYESPPKQSTKPLISDNY